MLCLTSNARVLRLWLWSVISEIAQVVDTLPHWGQGPAYSTWLMPWLLMTRQHNEQGHQQSWYLPYHILIFPSQRKVQGNLNTYLAIILFLLVSIIWIFLTQSGEGVVSIWQNDIFLSLSPAWSLIGLRHAVRNLKMERLLRFVLYGLSELFDQT